MTKDFLPMSKQEMRERGWGRLDIILISGDAYVDHPAYGTAMIGRVLEDAGFKVGIISQPNWQNADDFKKLGAPRLFWGISAGNLDSMVANYTAAKKPRHDDSPSPLGFGELPAKAGNRPDRAVIVYANRVREAFRDVPIVIGGLEAGMRRLAHYDYWSDKIRRSLIVDAKADILVYGMGETPVVEIAQRLAAGEKIATIDNVRGTVVIRKTFAAYPATIELPSFEEISQNKDKFNLAFRLAYENNNPVKGKTLTQKHGDRFVVQFPASMPLSEEQMDKIYSLPFQRAWHPAYDKAGGVKGLETVRFSVISHRGCPGQCSFCSLYMHQGRIVQSRSPGSILEEIRRIAEKPDFRGTITDIGAATANLYRASCSRWSDQGPCSRKCLVPTTCKNLKIDYPAMLDIWKKAASIPKVKHIFVGSGVRYDTLIAAEAQDYLNELCRLHVSGQLKVAPEHCAAAVLSLMNKPDFSIYQTFCRLFDAAAVQSGKKLFLVNYFLSGHPGCELEHALQLAIYLARHHIRPEQVQDYLPLPMTASACMYYSAQDPFSGRPVHVPGPMERRLQRALIQHRIPANRTLVIEALRVLKKPKLVAILLGKS